jgi:hypothetical protein
VALSDATPDNGCLYMLPRAGDPAYTGGDCSEVSKGRQQRDSFALLSGPLREAVYVPLTPEVERSKL